MEFIHYYDILLKNILLPKNDVGEFRTWTDGVENLTINFFGLNATKWTHQNFYSC